MKKTESLVGTTILIRALFFCLEKGGKMPYYTQEQIEKARQMDLLTYLQNYEPQELVHVAGKTYCTREHDSLKISNGKWMWWSRGFGGASALDYLIEVRGDPFTKAMEKILGQEAETPSLFIT